MNSEWRKHGWLIASLSTICFIGMGATISGIGLFFDPVRDELGWNSEQVSGLASAFLISTSLSALLAGWLLDRLGARPVMAAGAAIASAGYLWASVANSRTAMLLAFAVSGAGIGASAYVPCMFVAAKRMTQALGLAIGIILSAASAGSALLPPVIAHLIVQFGWRFALASTGWLLLFVSLPLVIATMPGRTPLADATASDNQAPSGRELGQALRAPAFWGICAIYLFFFAGFMGIYFHIIPFLVSRGYSLETTAAIYGGANAISAVGLVLIGWLADRYGAQGMLIANLILYAASLFLLDLIGGPAQSQVLLAMFVLIWGVTQGAPTQLAPILLARSMGLRHFGALTGVAGLIHGAANAAGPIMTGAIFDRTGSYLIAFHVCALAALLAAVPAMFVPGSIFGARTAAPGTTS